MTYGDRLKSAEAIAREADRLLREFAAAANVRVAENETSLLLRSERDGRAAVFQPAPSKGKPGLRVQFHQLSDDDVEAAEVRRGIISVGGDDAPIFAFIPLDHLVRRWDEVITAVLEPFFQSVGPLLELGQRMRLKHSIERFPLVLDAGMTGTVVTHEQEVISVRLDEHVPGLTDWDNQVEWYSETDALRDLEPVSTDSRPFDVKQGWFIRATFPGHQKGALRRYRVDSVLSDRVVLREMWVDWKAGGVWRASGEPKDAFKLDDVEVIAHDPPDVGAKAADDPRAPRRH